MNPVAEQLAAFNARDLEHFVACYIEDIVIEDGADKITMKGRQAMRENYGRMFENYPDLHCEIASEMSVGEYVIHEERLTGAIPAEMHAVVIYRVAGEQIEHCRIIT